MLKLGIWLVWPPAEPNALASLAAPEDEDLEARWEQAWLAAEKSEMLQELFAELSAAHRGHSVQR